MSIKIQNFDKTETILESSVRLSGEPMPRVLFTRKDWKILPAPRWNTNRSNQREGNFKHYNGSDDRKGSIKIYLYGPDRETNLEKLRSLDEPVYFDADEVDTNDTGNYVMIVSDYDIEFANDVTEVSINLEAYNN